MGAAGAHYAASVSTEPGAEPDRTSGAPAAASCSSSRTSRPSPTCCGSTSARAGYGVEVVGDGASALDAARDLRPSAIVLDIGLPVLDGIEVCRRLRGRGDWTPVLFVTARDDEVDRIVGLELGADDYVTKPFSPRELVARLGGVLRRTRGEPTPPRCSALGDLTLDLTSHEVRVAGREIALTATEFDLLSHLMRRPGVVFTREQLLSDVWGYAATAGGRTVDVHVAQVRAKLGDASPIRTVRSVGYAAERAPPRRRRPRPTFHPTFRRPSTRPDAVHGRHRRRATPTPTSSAGPAPDGSTRDDRAGRCRGGSSCCRRHRGADRTARRPARRRPDPHVGRRRRPGARCRGSPTRAPNGPTPGCVPGPRRPRPSARWAPSGSSRPASDAAAP